MSWISQRQGLRAELVSRPEQRCAAIDLRCSPCWRPRWSSSPPRWATSASTGTTRAPRWPTARSTWPGAVSAVSSVLVGYPAAQAYLGSDGHTSTIYVCAQVGQVDAVQELLAATASPQAPSQVNVSQPSQALVARADTQAALKACASASAPSASPTS